MFSSESYIRTAPWIELKTLETFAEEIVLFLQHWPFNGFGVWQIVDSIATKLQVCGLRNTLAQRVFPIICCALTTNNKCQRSVWLENTGL